ncbi:hypothetical protein [Marinicrinis lubricantis]|uniref:Uncharacterized protein n=1 Tax=Marinicrinis lubricantis TaxID=2086470 RepID=A0ABW1IN30_9BACL
MSLNVNFEPPSPLWKWFLYPMMSFSVIGCLYYTFSLIHADPVNLGVKIKLIASIFALFASSNLLIGYRYLLWATPIKNKLFQLSQKKPDIIQYRFGRFFIAEKILDAELPSHRWFKRLQQKDIQEVYEKDNK